MHLGNAANTCLERQQGRNASDYQQAGFKTSRTTFANKPPESNLKLNQRVTQVSQAVVEIHLRDEMKQRRNSRAEVSESRHAGQSGALLYRNAEQTGRNSVQVDLGNNVISNEYAIAGIGKSTKQIERYDTTTSSKCSGKRFSGAAIFNTCSR